MTGAILIGKDANLLKTRAAVVARAGVQIVSSSSGGLNEMNPGDWIDLVIICHTVGKAKDDVIRLARQKWSQAKILQLTSRLDDVFGG